MKKVSLIKVLFLVAFSFFFMSASNGSGLFKNSCDVGSCKLKGSMSYDKVSNVYALTGAGLNMWLKTDEFFMAWQKETGDFSLSAKVAFKGKGVNAHRKLGLIIRESLAADAKYADITVHGDGLTSLQYREKSGELTKEIVSPAKAPDHILLQRIGKKILVKTGAGTYPEKIVGEIELDFPGTCYIGLFVCSHDVDVLETAYFSDVEYKKL